MQLEEFGMNVERAVDGKNAVEIFRNHPEGTFDVILMDIMMPEMNGYELCRKIKEDMNINHIQVIIANSTH